MRQTEAFAKYGAKLRNRVWAFSDIANSSLVLSCWSHRMRPTGNGRMRYTDRFSDWKGARHGRKLLTSHLNETIAKGYPVRLVLATLKNPNQSTAGDASKLPKDFSPAPTVVGRVLNFDGNEFVIEFRMKKGKVPTP
jgi:hypothetical protein